MATDTLENKQLIIKVRLAHSSGLEGESPTTTWDEVETRRSQGGGSSRRRVIWDQEGPGSSFVRASRQ